MQLNPEGMQRFQQHLQNVLRNPCAVCGTGNWQFDDTIFELRQLSGNVATQITLKPVVTITCNGCGNIIFLNAITTGIVQVVANQAPSGESKIENITPEDATKIEA